MPTPAGLIARSRPQASSRRTTVCTRIATTVGPRRRTVRHRERPVVTVLYAPYGWDAGDVMPSPKKLDPGQGPRAYVGAEMRQAREAAGLTTADLAAALGYTGSYIGAFERGDRLPGLSIRKAYDTYFKTDGRFERMTPSSPGRSSPAGSTPGWRSSVRPALAVTSSR